MQEEIKAVAMGRVRGMGSRNFQKDRRKQERDVTDARETFQSKRNCGHKTYHLSEIEIIQPGPPSRSGIAYDRSSLEGCGAEGVTAGLGSAQLVEEGGHW